MNEPAGDWKAKSSTAKAAGWSHSQQTALIILLMLTTLYAAFRFYRNPEFVSNPQPSLPSRASDLADRLDPNTATAETLSALPQVGEKRARDLISYRERFKAKQKDGIVFHRSLDLLRVPGFGLSLMNQMEPYLIFPSTAPSTVPAD